MNSIRTLKLTLAVAGGLGCVGLVVGVYLLCYAPLHAEAAELKRAGDELKELHETRPRVVADNRDKKQMIDRLQSELKLLNDRIPNDSREDQLLNAVSKLAKKTNVTLPDFQPGGGSQWGELHSVIVRLHLRGTYAGICEFLRGLESLPRVSRVTQLSLRVVDRDKGTLEGSVELHGLYRKPNPANTQPARRP